MCLQLKRKNKKLRLPKSPLQTIEHFSNASKFSNDATTLSQSAISNPDDPSKPVGKPEAQGQHQQSPPKDPEFRSPTKENFANNSTTPKKSESAVLKDLGSPSASELTPEMQAKREVLYANLLKRKEQVQSNFKNEENSQLRIFVPSLADPSLKLFAKKPPKSNRNLIINAIKYSVFPGTVTSEQRIKVQEALASSDSMHFLILFRDQKCQYRGLYTWDTMSDTAHKIHGTGPKVCKEEMLTLIFKYDTGAKEFKQIQGMKHLSLTTNAFTIEDHYWQKTTIPYSGAR